METKKPSWFNEHIVSLIASAIIIFTFTTYMLVLTKSIPASESTAITIISSQTNILMLVVGFYFGSSKSSKDKQLTIEKTGNVEEPKI